MKSAAYNAFTVTLCVLYLSVIACPITHADRAKPAAFKDPARELWMTGYLKMQAADKAEKAGNPVLALERYEEAHNVFLEVRNKYPDWNASLLSYRAQYCKEKIGGLRETVAAQQETLSKESLVTLTRRQTAHIQELETTIGDLERRLELTATSLERARREAARNASARERVDELVADNSRLSTRAETMQGHIRELQQQVAKLKENAGLQEVAQELRNELDVTAARQQELESAAKTYRENMENLRANLKKVSVERVQLKRDNEVLKELFDRAKERIATFEDDTDTLEQQLATTRSEARKASTALAVETKKRENLQEQLATIAKELREARGFRDKYFATQGQTDKQEDARTVETVKALTKLLQEKEKHVQELKDLTQNLTADVQTQKQALEQKQQELVEQNRLVAQHKQGLRRLEKQNAALLDRLGQEESGRSRTKESSETLRNEYEKLEDRTAGLEKENLRLTEKNKAQLTLLRQQEKQLKNLRREQAQMKFTQGTSEQDSPVTALKEELQRTEQSLKEALTFKEYAQQKISDLEKQLASAKSKKPAGMDSHLPQDLKQVQRELEEKQAHIERLEKALAQQTATPDDQTPPPAITQNGKTPKPSERDKELVIAGLLEKAVAAEKSGDEEAAVWNYKNVLKHDPDNKNALQRLGIIAARHGNDKEAIDYLQRAFYQDPDNMTTLATLGFALVREEKPDLAISMLSRAVALNADNPDAHRNLGVACSTLGWPDAAEIQFRRALAIDADDSDAAFNLAVVLATKEPPDMQEATKWYRRARELGVPPDQQLDQYFGLNNDKKPDASE